MYMSISSNNPLPTLAWEWWGVKEIRTADNLAEVQVQVSLHPWSKYFSYDLEDNFRWM